MNKCGRKGWITETGKELVIRVKTKTDQNETEHHIKKVHSTIQQSVVWMLLDKWTDMKYF